MTRLTKIVQRATVGEYGYGRQRRPLVVSLEPGDVIGVRELRSRRKLTATIEDLRWWLLRSQADKKKMERLRLIKERKAAKRRA